MVAFLVLFIGAIMQAHAKTVALWKLDISPFTGVNARCLVDPANDFDVVIQGQQKEPPSTRPARPSGMAQTWSPLPPNPDRTEGVLDSPASTNAVYYEHGILFSSTGVVAAVNTPTRSFTVEGWHWRQNWYVPSIGAFTSFFALGRADGWRFSLYNLDDTNTLYFLISDTRAPNTIARRFPVPIPKATIYQKWSHYALVYDSEGGGGLGTWEAFLDAQSYGIVTNSSRMAAPGSAEGFHLGGDGIGSQYFDAGGYDYWRISDEALAPEHFLNAGTASIAPQTLAFYRLDMKPDGSLDLTNRAANAHHLQAPVGNSETQVTANVDQAVASVPNPDTRTPFLGGRTNNAGSVTFRTAGSGSRSYLYSNDGLGQKLGTNSAWTVEGWVKFTALVSRQVIFDAKANGGLQDGWMFMNYNGLNKRYCLFVGSTPGYIAFPDSTGNETPLNEWLHLALTFDPVSGSGYQGVWECFLNGSSLGQIEYSNTYTRVNTSPFFSIGGRASTWDDALYGSMDLVRVSQGILATNQFLNAGGYAATTNVVATLAYWKLDSDGNTTDSSSQVEPRYALGLATNTAPPAGSTQRIAGTLFKHDTTPTFIGDPAANAGSLLFTNGTALTTGNLGVRLELDTPFTVEGWMKWNGGATRSVQALAGTRFDTETGLLLPPVGTANRVQFGIPAGWLLTLEKRGADAAFHLACDTAVTNVFTGSTRLIGADLAILPAAQLAGRWRHVALAYDPAVDDCGQWTLYLDGAAVGVASNPAAPFVHHESPRFLLGGRANGTDSFDGLLDCWRVSSGLVALEDLLYFDVLRGTLIRVQ
jgi:hypothetical protein